MEEKSYRREKGKKWFHPDLNRGPSLRQSDVITNYTMKPLNIRPSKRKIIVVGKKKEKECREERKGRKRKGKKRERIKKRSPWGSNPRPCG